MTTRLTPTATNALATALVALAVIAGLASFEALVSPPWLPVAVRAVLITALALIVSRTVIGGRRARVARATGMSVDDGGHRHLLPPLIGLLVAVGVLVMEFGRSYSDSGWTLEPESLERLAGLFGQSWEYLTASRPPLEADAPVVIVVVSGGLLVLLLGDLFASTFRLPLLSALAIIALWLPNLALAGGLPWETLAVGVLVIVLLLCLRPAGAGRRRPSNPLARRAARRRTLRTGATALAVTALSLAVTAASTGMTPLVEGWRAHFIHSGGSWTMHTDLDVAASLGPRSTATLFRYAVIGLDGTRLAQDVGPLRLLTMSEFDGRNWEPPRLLNHGEAGPLDLLGTQGVSPAVWRPDLPARQVVFALDALQERNLPLPLEPRTVAADGTWHYDHRRDVLTSPEPIGHGFSYSVTVIPRHLDPAWLRSRPLGLPESAEPYLAVPESAHAEQLQALARYITGGHSNAFDQAVALQAYLRNPNYFTYSYTVPPGDSGDPVWDFLIHRTGFCVQYATAFVVLARHLGLPTRMALGFLPGTYQGGEFHVSTLAAHAWPEVYFSGAGWVRFEPTPAIQAGPPPTYAESPPVDEDAYVPAANDDVPPSPTPTPGGAPQEAPPPSDPSAAVPAPPSPADDGATFAWGRAGLLALLGAALVVGVGALWRRRHRPPRDVEEAWTRLTSAYRRAGVTLPIDVTPARAPAELAAGWQSLNGQPLPPGLAAAVARLAAALEGSRYRPTARDLTPGTLAQLVRQGTPVRRSPARRGGRD